jgi:hypothetical protein
MQEVVVARQNSATAVKQDLQDLDLLQAREALTPLAV